MKFNIVFVVFSFMALTNKTDCSLQVLFLSTRFLPVVMETVYPGVWMYTTIDRINLRRN